jgi:hypothetical protein
MSKKKLALIIALILLIITFSIAAQFKHEVASAYGFASVTFELPNTDALTMAINGQKMNISGLNNTYKLKDGAQQLVVQKTGFKPFRTNFQITKNQTLVITVAMQSTAPQSTTIATEQVQTAFNPAGFTVTQATYFYSNTWVVATVSVDGRDSAVIVAQYVGGSQNWKTVLGPGTIFFPSDTINLPQDVTNYLDQQHYILQEGDDT